VLVGGASTGAARVTVVDHLVTDADRFVPLVVEIDTRDITREPRWAEMELGCVTPCARRRGCAQRLAAGAPSCASRRVLFDAYFETKGKHPTGTYVVRQRERAKRGAGAAESATPACSPFGPDIHQVRRSPDSSRLRLLVGRRVGGDAAIRRCDNIAPTQWTWQGQTHSSFEVRKRHLPALRSIWAKTFGDSQPSGLEFLEGHFMGEAWDQPYVQLQPWAFMPTAEGWSTLVDGFHRYPGYDGMRAVIASDWFSSLAMVYRLLRCLVDSHSATGPDVAGDSRPPPHAGVGRHGNDDLRCGFIA